MRLSDHFDIEELVPPSIFNKYKESSIWFIDPKIIVVAEALRTLLNRPMFINTWSTGGIFENRGFRHPTTTIGAKLSQHRFGRAIDFHCEGITAEQIRQIILNNEAYLLGMGLTCLEKDTPTWVHVDCRNTGSNKILIISP